MWLVSDCFIAQETHDGKKHWRFSTSSSLLVKPLAPPPVEFQRPSPKIVIDCQYPRPRLAGPLAPSSRPSGCDIPSVSNGAIKPRPEGLECASGKASALASIQGSSRARIHKQWTAVPFSRASLITWCAWSSPTKVVAEHKFPSPGVRLPNLDLVVRNRENSPGTGRGSFPLNPRYLVTLPQLLAGGLEQGGVKIKARPASSELCIVSHLSDHKGETEEAARRIKLWCCAVPEKQLVSLILAGKRSSLLRMLW